MLVSGVRSSCEASATNSTLAVERGLRLAARLVERGEHLASVRARSATSSSAAGIGSRMAGSRVRAIFFAERGQRATGLIARRASASPASSASAVPAITPKKRKPRTCATVCSTCDIGFAYWSQTTGLPKRSSSGRETTR